MTTLREILVPWETVDDEGVPRILKELPTDALELLAKNIYRAGTMIETELEFRRLQDRRVKP